VTYRGLLLLGCGGHARSIADIALDCGIAELVFVDARARDDELIAGFRVVREWPGAIGEGWAAFPAVGTSGGRKEAVDTIRRRGMTLATLVSRRAYIGHGAVVGAGTLVAHGAHVGPFALVGEGAIINTSALVDHESVVGDYAHVAINATIAGRCRIGRQSFVGAGAVLVDNVGIADDVTIGAGAVVIHDIDLAGIYVGVPARLVRATL
jgi:sugar O-acyltransferase (sialic acid O-acetyltransferase NeuD family)